MRKALEDARKTIERLEGNIVNLGQPFIINLFTQIDEALAEPPSDTTQQLADAEEHGYNKALKEFTPTAAQVQRWLAEAREEGQEDKTNETISSLYDLPRQIKAQSLKLAESARNIEEIRARTEKSKLNATELVTDMREGDKQKYSNDKARNAAQAGMLEKDEKYTADCDKLTRLVYQQKVGEIDLACLRDTFRATIAIAEMR